MFVLLVWGGLVQTAMPYIAHAEEFDWGNYKRESSRLQDEWKRIVELSLKEYSFSTTKVWLADKISRAKYARPDDSRFCQYLSRLEDYTPTPLDSLQLFNDFETIAPRNAETLRKLGEEVSHFNDSQLSQHYQSLLLVDEKIRHQTELSAQFCSRDEAKKANRWRTAYGDRELLSARLEVLSRLYDDLKNRVEEISRRASEMEVEISRQIDRNNKLLVDYYKNRQGIEGALTSDGGQSSEGAR